MMKNRMLQLALIPLLSLAGVYIIEAKSKPSSGSQTSSSTTQQAGTSSSTGNPVQTTIQQYKNCPQGSVGVVVNFPPPAIGSAIECMSFQQIKANVKAKAPDLILGSCTTAKSIPNTTCFTVDCKNFEYHYYVSNTNWAVPSKKCPIIQPKIE